MKLVLVEWVDSHSGRGWQPLDELKELAEATHCRSVGWLASDKGGVKLLVPHLSGERNSGIRPFGTGDIAIPNKCITKMTVLRSR